MSGSYYYDWCLCLNPPESRPRLLLVIHWATKCYLNNLSKGSTRALLKTHWHTDAICCLDFNEKIGRNYKFTFSFLALFLQILINTVCYIASGESVRETKLRGVLAGGWRQEQMRNEEKRRKMRRGWSRRREPAVVVPWVRIQLLAQWCVWRFSPGLNMEQFHASAAEKSIGKQGANKEPRSRWFSAFGELFPNTSLF